MFKTTLLSLLGFLAFSYNLFAQQWETEMLNPDANFYSIQAAFNAEWQNKSYVKGEGYKQFKRWENFWETRILPDGSFPMQSKQIWSGFKSHINASLNKSGGIGNWSPIGPFDHTNTDSWSPGSGRVNCIVEDPNNSAIIYIGAPAGGVWKSTDSGSSWTSLGDELSVIGVSGIAIDPANSNIVYLATGDSDGGDTYSIGVMKSTDAGLTWNSVGGITANQTTKIIIDPTNSNTLWLATSVGVMKSTNAGVNWTNVHSGNIKDIALKPGVSSTIYATTGSDFYVSTNNGTTWNNTTTGLPATAGRLAIAVTADDNSYVYVLASKTDWSFDGVYRSTDSGSSFTAMNTTTDIFESTQAWYDMAIAADDTDKNTIITGVLNVWRSTNGGTSFTQLNNWSSPGGSGYTHADIHYLQYFNGTVYCGSDGGIYKSTNDGTTFTDLTDGLQIGQFYRIGGSQNDVTTIAGGLQDNGGYAYVGGTWKVWYGADGMEAGVDPNNSNRIFGMIQFGDLYRSNNGANSGNGLGSPEQGRWVTPMQMDPNNPRLLAGYNDLHEYSFAGGWNQISTFNFPQLLRSIEIYDANSDIIFCGTDDNIYKTTNGGTAFTDITGTLSSVSGTITSIEVNPSDDNEIWVSISGWVAADHVFHTTDNGATWNNITGTLPNLPCNIVKYDPGGTGGLYVGTDIGVYYRDDVTGTWVQYMNNLPNVIVNDLEINENANVIRAGTYGRGVWESGTYAIENNDAAISGVVAPNENYCNVNTFDPIVTLTNFGSLDLTSATITYDIDGGTSSVYNWTGLLTTGNSIDVTLPTMTSTAGAHTFNVSSSMPNGVADEEPLNDASSSSFSVVLGAVITTFNLTPDCWGSEVTWEIYDLSGTEVASGGPYTDGTQGIVTTDSVCLQPACYDFSIFDAYGDGMHGSQWGSCSDDGYYNMTNSAGDTLMEMLATDSDYGTQEDNSFCITSTLDANFSASSTVICEGESIDFSDLSLGTPTSWNWSFENGTPGTSTSQNVTGVVYATAGTYDVELIISDGVTNDTLLMVDYITVNAPNSGSASVTACDSYTWSANGTTYNATGTFNATLTNAAGCDSIATLNLTINNSSSGSQSISACDSYTWASNGQTYTSTGMYTTTLTNAVGCDSIATLDLTIGNSNSGSASITSCGSYTWSATGNTYTSSGTFATTLTNSQGCDSIATLNLTINNNTTATEYQASCNTYTWPINGSTYTSSGMYTGTIPNAAGCDSVITLDLTIHDDISTVQNVTSCASYTWPADGNTYTSNGTHVAVLPTINGCDSTITLNLTISTTASTTQNVASCGPYTWSATGTTYSTSGNYNTTITSSTGCDSTVTLNLTINSATSGSANVSACETYTWSANGLSYTSTGSYSTTLLNSVGCDSTATLNLTIHNSEIGATETVNACNSYTWAANSNTYTSSGLYTAVLQNMYGCDSTVSLDLTVNTSNVGSATITACDSYTWSANGITYTSGGTYAATLTNVFGCDSTATLNLTINASSSDSQTMVACDTYTWPVDGNDYTTSGQYVATLTNAAGCDSTVTLDLTINNSYSNTETVTACDSYTWPINGVTYTTGGTYYETYATASGCDSTYSLDLTLNSVNTGITQTSNITLEADASGATYQWLDCNSGYQVIPGETSQSFIATSNSDYAVEVTSNGCVDTSACITIAEVGLSDLDIQDIDIYPNPTDGVLHITLGNTHESVTVELYTLLGQRLQSQTYTHTNNIDIEINGVTGYYMLKLSTNEDHFVHVKVRKL